MKIAASVAFLLLGLFVLILVGDALDRRLFAGATSGGRTAEVDAVFLRILWAGIGIAIYLLVLQLRQRIRNARNATPLQRDKSPALSAGPQKPR